MPIAYSQPGIEDALSDLRFVKMDPVQEELVDSLAKLVASRIGMEELTCSGFWHFAVRDWQIAHDITVDTLKTVTPKERITHATEIKDRFQEYVVRILKNPADKGKLASALDEAFQMYLHSYAERKG